MKGRGKPFSPGGHDEEHAVLRPLLRGGDVKRLVLECVKRHEPRLRVQRCQRKKLEGGVHQQLQWVVRQGVGALEGNPEQGS